MKNCTDSKKQRESCINFNNVGVCIQCRRFYTNLPTNKEDLYKNKKEFIPAIKHKPKLSDRNNISYKNYEKYKKEYKNEKYTLYLFYWYNFWLVDNVYIYKYYC